MKKGLGWDSVNIPHTPGVATMYDSAWYKRYYFLAIWYSNVVFPPTHTYYITSEWINPQVGLWLCKKSPPILFFFTFYFFLINKLANFKEPQCKKISWKYFKNVAMYKSRKSCSEYLGVFFNIFSRTCCNYKLFSLLF